MIPHLHLCTNQMLGSDKKQKDGMKHSAGFEQTFTYTDNVTRIALPWNRASVDRGDPMGRFRCRCQGGEVEEDPGQGGGGGGEAGGGGGGGEGGGKKKEHCG